MLTKIVNSVECGWGCVSLEEGCMWVGDGVSMLLVRVMNGYGRLCTCILFFFNFF